MLAMLGHVLSLVTAPGAPAAASNTVTTTVTSAAGTAGSAAGFTPFATGPDPLGVGPHLAIPLMNAATYLIPAGVALAGLHKLLSHQETGAGFLVDMLIKGGGAILIIQLMKSLSGLA